MSLDYIDYQADAVEVARKLAEERARREAIYRTDTLHVRVTRAEKAMIKRVAKEVGLNFTSFTRDAVLDVTRAIIEQQGEEPEA